MHVAPPSVFVVVFLLHKALLCLLSVTDVLNGEGSEKASVGPAGFCFISSRVDPVETKMMAHATYINALWFSFVIKRFPLCGGICPSKSVSSLLWIVCQGFELSRAELC